MNEGGTCWLSWHCFRCDIVTKRLEWLPIYSNNQIKNAPAIRPKCSDCRQTMMIVDRQWQYVT